MPPTTARADLYSAEALAAREAEILGQPQRIAPLSIDEIDDDARALVISVRESVGLTDHSKLPEVFATMLRHPDLYRCQMEMGTQLFKGAIPPRERELAVLRVGWRCRAPYEWGQHVEIAKRYGVTPAEVERVTEGPESAGWSAFDTAILRGVDELIDDQMISDATWDRLASQWSDRQLIEFPSLVGQYVALAYSQNSLRLRLNPENRGMRHR